MRAVSTRNTYFHDSKLNWLLCILTTEPRLNMCDLDRGKRELSTSSILSYPQFNYKTVPQHSSLSW